MLANGALALPGAAEGTIKSGSYKGSIVVNGQPIEARSAPTCQAGRSLPPISGPTCSISAGSAAARRRARRHAASMAALLQPIGTPLRSVDGTLKVAAATLVGPPMRLATPKWQRP